MRLFVGDDWAEGHHDVEVMDEAGTVLARKRLPGGVAGVAQLHVMAGGLLGEDADDGEVLVGIETDHGPWVMALLAAGYRVFPVNPQQSARFRARHSVSGAKSDARGRARAGGHGPHRFPPAARGRRGLAGGSGHQGAGPHA
jgi:hypothetical protein